MRLLVIQHDSDKGLGLLEAPLRNAAAELDICFAGRDPLAITDHSGVMALPGLANPHDDTEAVSATRSCLRDALDRDLPVLGICLGAELLAEAAGAETARCQAEYGYWPVSLTTDGVADPLLSGLPSGFEAFQAHAFAAALPDGAVALAHSEHALQAFRVGSRGMGPAVSSRGEQPDDHRVAANHRSRDGARRREPPRDRCSGPSRRRSLV